jgi:hypothetical protein
MATKCQGASEKIFSKEEGNGKRQGEFCHMTAFQRVLKRV